LGTEVEFTLSSSQSTEIRDAEVERISASVVTISEQDIEAKGG
jgi:hypothetical protein